MDNNGVVITASGHQEDMHAGTTMIHVWRSDQPACQGMEDHRLEPGLEGTPLPEPEMPTGDRMRTNLDEPGKSDAILDDCSETDGSVPAGS